MNRQQEENLMDIKFRTVQRMDKKYRAGAEEHDSDLLDLTARELLEEAIGEAIDQLTYLLTLEKKLSTRHY